MIQNQWKILFTVAITTMMATMDASIINIAFPELTRVFEVEVAVVMWVFVVFTLVSTTSMLIIGKIGDMTISCGTAIVTEAFPPCELGKGLGLLGVSVSMGFIAGPVIGGLLLDFLDWRSIFYLRIPLGVAALLMAIVYLQNDQVSPGKTRLDLLGTLTSSAGIFLLVFSLGQMGEPGSASFPVLPVGLLGLILIAVFVFIERRAQNPIVDPRLFKDRVFSSAIGGLLLIFVAASPYILIVPFYLMVGLHMRASEAGMLMAVTSVATMVFGPASGWLSDRFGRMWFAAAGAAGVAAAFVFMLGFDLETSAINIAAVFFLLGMGAGTFQPANNSIIMGAVSREHLGTASALIATQRQVGIAIGMAVNGALFSAWKGEYRESLSKQGIDGAYAHQAAVSMAFHDLLFISVIISLFVVLLSLLPLWSKAKRTLSR